MNKKIFFLFFLLVPSSILVNEVYGYWTKTLLITANISTTQPSLEIKKITGGGSLVQDQGKKSFGFNAIPRENGLDVNLEFNDHLDSTNPIQIKVQNYAYNVSTIKDEGGKTIGLEFDISGKVRADAEKDRLDSVIHVRTVDNGEPGKNDEFILSITKGPEEGYVSGDGTITNGNIQVHR